MTIEAAPATTAAPATQDATAAATTAAPATAAPAAAVVTETAAPAATTGTPASTAPAAATPAAAATVPEKYEFVAPEGTTLDGSVVTAFSEVSKDIGLSQEAAQKVIDKLAPTLAARSAEAAAQVRSDLLSAAKADPEIGGDKFDATVAKAKVTMEACFTPAFSKFLDESGLGNHPEMIRGLAKASAAFAQDGHIPGGKQPTQDKSAQSFYKNSSMNP